MSAGNSPAPSTRDRIVAAAQALFLRDGYAAVGINAICAEAAVVKGSFYHFFPAKADLLAAVIARNHADLLAVVAAAGSGASDGRGQLLAQFESLLESAQRTGAAGRMPEWAIGTLACSVPADQIRALRAAGEALDAWRELLATQIRHGIADGSIARSVEPESTALSLLAVLQGMAALGRCGAGAARLRAIAQNAVKRLLPVGPTAALKTD